MILTQATNEAAPHPRPSREGRGVRLFGLALFALLLAGCKGEPGEARSQEEIDKILQKSATGMGKPAAAPGVAPPGGR